MPPKSVNFFGLGPGQMDASQSPALLAQQMALQEYNNPTSSQAQPSSGGGGMNPQVLAKAMMGNGQPMASDGLQVGKLYNGGNPSDIPQTAQSWNTGVGPLPWLPQNALPWSGGNG